LKIITLLYTISSVSMNCQIFTNKMDVRRLSLSQINSDDDDIVLCTDSFFVILFLFSKIC